MLNHHFKHVTACAYNSLRSLTQSVAPGYNILPFQGNKRKKYFRTLSTLGGNPEGKGGGLKLLHLCGHEVKI